MESFEERYARQMKEREEQLEQSKLEQQLKIKKMFKTIGASVVGFILLVVLFNSSAVYLLVANLNASYTAVFKKPSSISSNGLRYFVKIAGTFSLCTE